MRDGEGNLRAQLSNEADLRSRSAHPPLALHRLLLLGLLPGLLGSGDVPYASDAWIEVRTANFLLVSNAEQATTLRVAETLEQFRAVAPVLTGTNRVEPGLPIRVFVFRDRKSWSHFRNQDDLAGYFLNDMESNYIALEASEGARPEVMQTVLHEYVHLLSRNRRSRVHPPTWYEEGFADAISSARIEDGKIMAGLPVGRIAALRERDWLPLERVLTTRGYAGLSPDEISTFYAQSWLLVHRLTWGHVAGLEPRHDEVIEYIRRVAGGEPEEATFTDVMGVSLEKMEKELREYLLGDLPYVVLDEEPPDVPFAPRVRTLSQPEALVLLGELQLARGSDGAAEAETLARLALTAAPESPQAMLLLAAASTERGADSGSELAMRALAIAPESPAIVRGAARVSLLRLRNTALAESDRVAVATEARNLYAKAVALEPGSPAAHAGLGYAHLHLNEPVEASQSLQRAFLMARWNLDLVLALGELHARYGRPEDARKLLREVVESAHHEQMQVRARAILADLPESRP